MNTNYNTKSWIKSIYKNEKQSSHVGWVIHNCPWLESIPQEKGGDISPPFTLISGVEAFSLAVKRAQRAQNCSIEHGHKEWTQPLTPPLCLNASVKS